MKNATVSTRTRSTITLASEALARAAAKGGAAAVTAATEAGIGQITKPSLAISQATLVLEGGQRILLRGLRLTDEDLDGLEISKTSDGLAVEVTILARLVFEQPRDLARLADWAAEGDDSVEFTGYEE